MRGTTILLALSSSLLVASTALADVPNDPCMGATAGDPCTTLDGQDGTCVDDNGFLTCEEMASTTSGTTTGAGGSSSTGSEGGNGGSTSGGGEDEGGCAISEVGAGPSGTSGLLALLGLGLLLRRRRR